MNSQKEEEVEEYTPKEIEALDYYQEFTHKLFEDDDLYEVIIKYNYNDTLIKNELQEMMKFRSKGDEYSWQTVGKSKHLIKLFLS